METIELTETAKGVLFPVKALPGSRRNEIRGVHDGRLKISVTQIAEGGKANKAILKYLAQRLGVRRSQIRLIQGELTPVKVFAIDGVSILEVQKRLADLE